MKFRTFLVIAVVGLFFWGVWRLWSGRISRGGHESQGALNGIRNNPKIRDQVLMDDFARGPLGTPDKQKDRIVAVVRDAAQKANQQIEFYGRIIDQNSSPIPGVKVKIGVRWTEELLPGTSKDVFNRFELTTDSEGIFSLTDTKGSVVGIDALEKEGYEPAPSSTRRSYWYWAVTEDRKYTPDPRRPEIFHMWKNAGAENLVRKGISSALHYDGTPTTLNLMTGAVGGNADLQVALRRSPQQIEYGQRNYEWTLTLEALSGGLIESDEEQMYRAPADGYVSRLVVHMAANDPQWTDEKSFGVYLKLRGNLYGRAEVKALVGSDRATTPFYITSFINPNGSRNLEYDSLQDVAQPPGKIP